MELVPDPVAWDPLAGLCPRARVRWRRRRYPFLARRRWGGWPLRGTRVGEASHPGPSLTPSPGTPLGGERPELMDLDGLAGARARSRAGDGRPAHRRRLESSGSSVRCFCPVPGCGRGDPTRATGWSSHQAMRAHLDDHCSGTLAGAVPQDYLDAHSRDLCQECGLLVNKRYNGVHPPRARTSRHSLDEVMGHGAATVRHVPRLARAVWSQCLARALAATHSRNTVQAWLDGERVELWEELGEQWPQHSATGGERTVAACSGARV